MASRRVSKATDGVPSVGHKTPLRVFIDPNLLKWPEVWAAAGTWNDVFGSEPHKLVEAYEEAVIDLRRR
jgi:prolyl-tRNA editing enzyme YbaK/EbsC (Cys-tRNA(Pro) deacylase)